MSLSPTDENEYQEKYDEKKIKISVDLVQMATRQLAFLEKVEKHPNLHKTAVIKSAIRRYETVWLPLACKYASTTVVPPLDIAWVWHCHMLAPNDYEKDSNRIATFVNHRLLTERQYDEKLIYTKTLWESEFPDEAFEINFDDENFVDPKVENYRTKCRYSLEKAVARQRVFYYQVALPHYKDETFLKNAVKRYKKYLFLKKVNQKEFLVPCYDFDLIWHTHQLHPVIYKMDTEDILGKMLNHDDSVNDRSPDSRLNRADKVTRELWKKTFGEDFVVVGGMFRGEPAFGKLLQLTEEQIYESASKIARVTLSITKANPLNVVSLKLTSSLLHREGQKCERLTWKQPFVHPLCFTINTAKHWELLFNLSKSTGTCTKGKVTIAEGVYLLGRNLEEAPKGNYIFDDTVFPAVENESDITYVPEISFEANMEDLETGVTILQMHAGQFKTITNPKDIDELWGPVYLSKPSSDVTLSCSSALHRLVNHVDMEKFTCRVSHSIPLMMSGVQVFSGDKMAAVSHLIGSDQLPSAEQLSPFTSFPTLNVTQGERAMLIKDYCGDWAVITGQWSGFKHGIAGRPGVDGVHGKPGSFSIKFFNLRSRKITQRTFHQDPKYTFQFEDACIDFKTGKLQIEAKTNDVAQYICLAFSVAVLHVLCQPQAVKQEQGAAGTGNTRVKPNQNKKVQKIDVESLSLIKAAGYMCDVPCNSYIKAMGSGGSCAGCCAKGGDPGGCGGCGSCGGCGGCGSCISD